MLEVSDSEVEGDCEGCVKLRNELVRSHDRNNVLRAKLVSMEDRVDDLTEKLANAKQSLNYLSKC